MLDLILFSSLDHTFSVHLFYLLYMQETHNLIKKKLYDFKILFSYRRVSIKNQFFTGFVWHKNYLFCGLTFFYVSPCKKPFSNLYLFKFEHNFENKLLINRSGKDLILMLSLFRQILYLYVPLISFYIRLLHSTHNTQMKNVLMIHSFCSLHTWLTLLLRVHFVEKFKNVFSWKPLNTIQQVIL